MLHTSPVVVIIELRNFKKNNNNKLLLIHLKASDNDDICPLETPNKYLQTFGNTSGTFFNS